MSDEIDLTSLSYRHFDEHYPGPRHDELAVTTVFGGDPRERYREAAFRRMLHQLNGREPAPLPAFPNGWFAIAFAADLEPTEVRPLSIFGHEVVLYRTRTGRVHVLDAFCPHLGTHLGHGGTVGGELIVCPFHAWSFDGSGTCVKVPYSDEIPSDAKLRSWPILERNGLIFVWHHADGKDPDWEIRELPHFSNPDMRIAGYRCTYFTAHVQDVAENGVDLPHFRVLHKWEADQIEWSVHGPEYQMAYRIRSMRDRDRTAPEIHSTTHGPGYTYTTFEGNLRGVGTSAMTPIEPGLVQLLQVYVYDQRHSDAACETAIRAASLEWASDIPIWENKKTWLAPRLTADDGPIAAYRRWFNQFYSKPVNQGS